MAKKRTPMNKIKEVLRLKLGPSTISELLTRFKQSQLGWPLPDSCSDAELTQALYHGKKASREKVMPDFTQYAVELRRKGMTEMLLWQEYHEQYQEQAYAYTQFCEHFTRWFKTQKRSMRQLHVAGDKLFIDYCGPRLQVVNPDTGESLSNRCDASSPLQTERQSQGRECRAPSRALDHDAAATPNLPYLQRVESRHPRTYE